PAPRPLAAAPVPSSPVTASGCPSPPSETSHWICASTPDARSGWKRSCMPLNTAASTCSVPVSWIFCATSSSLPSVSCVRSSAIRSPPRSSRVRQVQNLADECRLLAALDLHLDPDPEQDTGRPALAPLQPRLQPDAGSRRANRREAHALAAPDHAHA